MSSQNYTEKAVKAAGKSLSGVRRSFDCAAGIAMDWSDVGVTCLATFESGTG